MATLTAATKISAPDPRRTPGEDAHRAAQQGVQGRDGTEVSLPETMGAPAVTWGRHVVLSARQLAADRPCEAAACRRGVLLEGVQAVLGADVQGLAPELLCHGLGAVHLAAARCARCARTSPGQFGYNSLALPIAAGIFQPLGFVLRPEIGAISMSGSSAIVASTR